MALPKYLLICCSYLVCLGPISAHRFLVGSMGSSHDDRPYFIGSAKYVEEAHGVPELTGLAREPAPPIIPDSIQPLVSPAYASEKAHINPTPNARLSISNDEAHVKPRSLTVGNNEFIKPPSFPGSTINAPVKPTSQLFLSISTDEARVTPNSFVVGDSESIKSPTTPHSTTNEAHMNPTAKPVLSIYRDEARSKPISSVHEPNTNRHDVGSNRPAGIRKSDRTGFSDIKDGSDGPFLPSPDCCYSENKAQNRPLSRPMKVEFVK